MSKKIINELEKDLEKAKKTSQQLNQQFIMVQGTISYLSQKIVELGGS